LTLRCPPNTVLASGLCFEAQPHAVLSYGTAVRSCTAINLGNRRLPSHAELQAYLAQGGTLAPGGEMTSTAFESRSEAGVIDVLLLAQDGSVTVASGAVDHPFRCVTNPTNG